jgi:hypothetical protein
MNARIDGQMITESFSFFWSTIGSASRSFGSNEPKDTKYSLNQDLAVASTAKWDSFKQLVR